MQNHESYNFEQESAKLGRECIEDFLEFDAIFKKEENNFEQEFQQELIEGETINEETESTAIIENGDGDLVVMKALLEMIVSNTEKKSQSDKDTKTAVNRILKDQIRSNKEVENLKNDHIVTKEIVSDHEVRMSNIEDKIKTGYKKDLIDAEQIENLRTKKREKAKELLHKGYYVGTPKNSIHGVHGDIEVAFREDVLKRKGASIIKVSEEEYDKQLKYLESFAPTRQEIIGRYKRTYKTKGRVKRNFGLVH